MPERPMPEPARHAWERIPRSARGRIVWILWFLTWLLLLAGLVDRWAYQLVVRFSAAHALAFLALHDFRLAPFPVQVRVAYLLWVAAGTHVPQLVFLMYVTTAGLVGNLFFRYCPLARLMYLLPWNRDERFSLRLVLRVFRTPPVEGRFQPMPPGGMA